MKFGGYLRAARLKKGLSLKELSTEIGCTGEYLGDIERGRRNPPSTEHIKKLASALGYDDILDTLLGYRDKDRGFVKIHLFRGQMITDRDATAILLARSWPHLGDDKIELIKEMIK